MDAVLRIVQNTPFWVSALLAILVVLGIQALKTRTISSWHLLIVPVVFVLWGVISVLLKATAFPIVMLDWRITGAIGATIAWLTAGLDGGRDRSPRPNRPDAGWSRSARAQSFDFYGQV
jgi:hypothetical protein